MSGEQCVICAQDRTKHNFVCDGCHLSYCSTHSAEHRQELNEELTKLVDEYKKFEVKIEEPSADYENLFKRINDWENESTKKIRMAADRARQTLKNFVSTSKELLKVTANYFATDLDEARRLDFFSEKNLKEWKISFKRLERQLNQRSTVKIIDDKTTPIHLIEVKIPDVQSRNESPVKISRYVVNKKERFDKVYGPVDVEENDLVVTHNGESDQYGYVRGKTCYGLGRNAVRFRIEQFQKPYALFFGCISSKTDLKEGIFKSDEAVGWFSCTQAYRYGHCSHDYRIHKYNGDRIERGDILTLVFDRELNEIQLINRRINMISVLQVGEQLKYNEWQFLVVLTYPGDSVRILLN